ncbi:hypothetical protein SBBP1_260048 [Burkholderiales bacterium]|nr:hypothetical protein SBBP1_260048 [Burkholderiales bacterium]
MKRTGILAASATHAHCIERTGVTGQPELLSIFECPQARSKGGSGERPFGLRGDGGQVALVSAIAPDRVPGFVSSSPASSHGF